MNAKQRKRNKKKAARAAKANGVATNDQDASPEVADSDGDEPSSPRPGNVRFRIPSHRLLERCSMFFHASHTDSNY